MCSFSRAAVNIKFTHTSSNQDDDILRSRKIEFSFYRKFDENVAAEDLIVKVALLECPIEREPLHPTKGELPYLATAEGKLMCCILRRRVAELYSDRRPQQGAQRPVQEKDVHDWRKLHRAALQAHGLGGG